MKQLRYIDKRPINMNLKLYGGKFIGLPMKTGDNVINVTDDEFRILLKRRNGTKPVFEPVQARQSRRSQETIEQSEE